MAIRVSGRRVAHRDGVCQIELGMGAEQQPVKALLLKRAANGGAHQSAVTGNVDWAVFLHVVAPPQDS